MKTEFENGSKIENIDSVGESQRGYIKSRRLTDKEYRRFLYNEQIQAEDRVSKLIKELGL